MNKWIDGWMYYIVRVEDWTKKQEQEQEQQQYIK